VWLQRDVSRSVHKNIPLMNLLRTMTLNWCPRPWKTSNIANWLSWHWEGRSYTCAVMCNCREYLYWLCKQKYTSNDRVKDVDFYVGPWPWKPSKLAKCLWFILNSWTVRSARASATLDCRPCSFAFPYKASYLMIWRRTKTCHCSPPPWI